MKPILRLIAGNAKFFSVIFHPEPTNKLGCKKLQVHSAVKLFAVTDVFPESMKALIFFVVVLLLFVCLFAVVISFPQE